MQRQSAKVQASDSVRIGPLVAEPISTRLPPTTVRGFHRQSQPLAAAGESLVEAIDLGRETAQNHSRLGEVRWEYRPDADASPFRSHIGGLVAGDVQVADLWRSGRQQVILLLRDYMWFPGAIIILDADGQVLGEYWHPGHLRGVAVFDHLALPRPHLLAWGQNNDLRSILGDDPDPASPRHRVVLALDPETMAGVGPTNLTWPATGREPRYRIARPRGTRMRDPRIIRGGPGLDPAAGPYIEVRLDGALIFHLDHEGRILDRIPNDRPLPWEHLSLPLWRELPEAARHRERGGRGDDGADRFNDGGGR